MIKFLVLHACITSICVFVSLQVFPNSAFLYLIAMNMISSLLSVWGLTIMKTITRPDLEQKFSINGKLASVQLTLITLVLTNTIVGVLVTTNAIDCTELYSSKSRAAGILSVYSLRPLYFNHERG
jgi:Organic solute transporter Ostalpha